jgi:hypothetical protein
MLAEAISTECLKKIPIVIPTVQYLKFAEVITLLLDFLK